MSKYIGSIDGLRAVAVLLVLFFHAGFEFARGGFIGVDVFFVISGFLITGIIHRDFQNGNWSFGKFYMRRAARLLPALFATIIATTFAGYFILGPDDLERLGQSGLYAAISASNIFFWLEAGYFDQAASTKPLLHTWSLGVEEQFYLVWPAIIILVASRFGKAALIPAICIIGALSFIGAIALDNKFPSAVFFLTPFRMYQFALGAVIALTFTLKTGHSRDVIGSLAILGLIVLAFVANGEVNSQLINATAPALCAAGFIWSSQSQVMHKVFASAPMRWIGERSYSIYLTHWPIMVMWSMATDYSLSPSEGAITIVLSILAGAALHTLVEKPLRFKSTTTAPQRLRSLTSAMMLLSASLIVSAHMWGLRGVPERMAPALRAAIGDMETLKRERLAPFGRPICSFTAENGLTRPKTKRCITDPLSKPGAVFVIGDSLANDFGPALKTAYPEASIGQLAAPGCNHAFSMHRYESAPAHCDELIAAAMEEIKRNNNIKTVVLSASWTPFGMDELRTLIADVEASGKEVIFVGQRAVFEERVPTIAAGASSISDAQQKAQKFIRAAATRKTESQRRQLESRVTYVDFARLQCTDVGYCPVFTENNDIIFIDHMHLSTAGILWIAEQLKTEYPDLLN